MKKYIYFYLFISLIFCLFNIEVYAQCPEYWELADPPHIEPAPEGTGAYWRIVRLEPVPANGLHNIQIFGLDANTPPLVTSQAGEIPTNFKEEYGSQWWNVDMYKFNRYDVSVKNQRSEKAVNVNGENIDIAGCSTLYHWLWHIEFELTEGPVVTNTPITPGATATGIPTWTPAPPTSTPQFTPTPLGSVAVYEDFENFSSGGQFSGPVGWTLADWGYGWDGCYSNPSSNSMSGQALELRFTDPSRHCWGYTKRFDGLINNVTYTASVWVTTDYNGVGWIDCALGHYEQEFAQDTDYSMSLSQAHTYVQIGAPRGYTQATFEFQPNGGIPNEGPWFALIAACEVTGGITSLSCFYDDFYITMGGISPTPTSTPTECVKGDVDCNDSITPGDALLAFQIYLNAYSPTGQESCDVLCGADWDSNGSITPGDALCVFRQYLNDPC